MEKDLISFAGTFAGLELPAEILLRRTLASMRGKKKPAALVFNFIYSAGDQVAFF